MRSMNPTLDPRFKELHNTIDAVFKKLRSEGVGSVTKSAELFTKDALWESFELTIHRQLFFLL